MYYDLKAFKHLGKVFLICKLIYIPARSFCICSIPSLLPTSLYLQGAHGQGTRPHIHLGNVSEGRKQFQIISAHFLLKQHQGQSAHQSSTPSSGVKSSLRREPRWKFTLCDVAAAHSHPRPEEPPKRNSLLSLPRGQSSGHAGPALSSLSRL